MYEFFTLVSHKTSFTLCCIDVFIRENKLATHEPDRHDGLTSTLRNSKKYWRALLQMAELDRDHVAERGAPVTIQTKEEEGGR